jgi:parallel beta-helix repeat protein
MRRNHKFNKNFIIGLSLLFVALVIISENITINSSSDIMSESDYYESNFGEHNAPLKDIKIPKSSDFWSNFTYIHITDLNWSIAASYDWCSGNGSYGNPYTIENITIDASSSPTGAGIYIENSTNDYFTIRNCTITGASNAGIFLRRTCNGTVINNNCSYNINVGISLEAPSIGPYTKNNTVINNTCNWNNYGIFMIYDQDNTITNNTISNNDDSGIMLSSNSGNNNVTNNKIYSDSSVNPETNYGIRTWWAWSNNLINNTIINCEFDGITVRWASNNNDVENNTIINCQHGIELYSGGNRVYNNRVKNNTITNATDSGIRMLDDVETTTITDNKMINCSILLEPISMADLQSNTIAANNTVNGKAVYCYENGTGLGYSNFTTYGDVGQIILINCNDSDISDFSIPNPIPISIYYSNNNTIDNNTLGLAGYGYSGILLCNSTLNNITRNTVIGGESYGLLLIESSDDNIVYGNILNSGGSAYDDQGTNNIFDWNVLNWVLSENPTIDESGAGNFTWIEAESMLAWVTGSGSWSEPYLISGLQINVSASTSGDGSGIRISDSHDVYFTIRNCSITNANIGSVAEPVSNYYEFAGGIHLINCSKGFIDNNTCDGGLNACGILVVNGSYNISIVKNLAFGNEKHGIMVANNSYDIYIDHNTAHSNYNQYSRGIYILMGCYNITISNNTMNDNEYNGIFLVNNCHDNWILNNTCKDTAFGNEQDEGIFLYGGCHNNTIAFNYICDNDIVGIRIHNGHDNIILYNTILENDGVVGVQEEGIYLYSDCDDNIISYNLVDNNDYHGIYLNNGCDNNTVFNNTAINSNNNNGILLLNNCHDNNISNNYACSNGEEGILLLNNCDNNTIFNNTCNNNLRHGIWLWTGCDYNNITDNTVNGNGDSSDESGIHLNAGCHNNIIENNTANGNHHSGIYLENDCDNNNITDNTANNNDEGIKLTTDCDDNIISYNIFDNNNYRGIFLDNGCDNNTILNNTAINSQGNEGIVLSSNSNDNFISKNYACFNNLDGIYIDNCDNNKVLNNTFNNNSRHGIHILSGSDYNNITGNNADNNVIGTGIDIRSSSNNTVENNTANYCGTGIIIAESSSDNTIVNNNCSYNWRIAIQLWQNCHRNIITNNILSYSSGAGDAAGTYLATNCDDNNFTGNVISYNSVYGVRILSDCDNNIFIGNIIDGNSWTVSSTTTIEKMNRFDGICTPLIIDDDGGTAESFTWEEVIAYVPWIGSDGSWADPYVIEDLYIDANNNGNGILIQDSHNVYFRIENCTFINADGASGYTNYGGGIKLFNSSNGVLFNNTCTNGGTYGCGILLYSGTHNITVEDNHVFLNSPHGILVADFSYNITIKGNTVTRSYAGSGRGIYLYNGVFNCTISNNNASDNGQAGICIGLNCYDNWIINNYADDTSAVNNQDYGIYLLDSDNNTVAHNFARDNDDYGIIMDDFCYDNWIYNNTCLDTAGGDVQRLGIYLNDYCENNTIINNDASDNSEWGIYLGDGCNYNKIINNTIDSTGGSGIHLTLNCMYNLITGNNVTNNEDHGIYFLNNCDNNNITHNLLYNNGISGDFDGIRLINVCDNNRITDNNCTSNTYNGIGLYGCAYNEIVNNSAIGNKNGIAISYDSGPGDGSDFTTVLGNNISYNWNTGITIYWESDDITIIGNLINNNTNYGIGINAACDRINITDNEIYNTWGTTTDHGGIRIYNNVNDVLITRNIFENNSLYGINIAEIDCDNMVVYNNSFITNTFHAYDIGTNTQWNNTVIGNYWDNYTGIDADDDGIGDTEYHVYGGYYDYLPIWWDAPVIIVVIPTKNYETGVPAPNYQIELNKTSISLSHVWYRLWNASYGYTDNETILSLTGTLNQTKWGYLLNGSVVIQFWVNDSRGYMSYTNRTVIKTLGNPTININSTILYNGKVVSFTAPDFVVTLSENYLGDPINYSWYVIDNSSTTSLKFFFTTNGTINQTIWDYQAHGEVVTIIFYVNDSFGEQGSNSVYITKDIVAPSITILSPSNYSIFGYVAPTISLSITESNFNVSWYSIYNGTWSNNYTISRNGGVPGIWSSVIIPDIIGMITIRIFVIDLGGNFNFTDFILEVDLKLPMVKIEAPGVASQWGDTPPIYSLDITETNLEEIYFTVHLKGELLITKSLGTTIQGEFPSDVWESLPNGNLVLTFYARDIAQNVGSANVMISKEATVEGMPFWIQALIAGAISGSVGLTIRIAYGRYKKKKEVGELKLDHIDKKLDKLAKIQAKGKRIKAPTKKYVVEHLDLVNPFDKMEQREFKVGVAQIGLSTTGDLLTELYYMDENHLMRIKEDKVDEVLENIEKKVVKAYENDVNIILFPEMSTDLNYEKMLIKIYELAEKYKMYIITGGYHDINTRQNVCMVIGPGGIHWTQEKHNPATIHFGKTAFTEAIHIPKPPHKIKVAETEYGRIAIAICRDFLDMDLRVEIKNCEPPVDLMFNPAYSPVTSDFNAIHFDVRRSFYAYTFYDNVAEYGGAVIYTPEKDRTERKIGKGEEGLICKEVDLFKLRSARKRWERQKAKERGFIQSTRQ